MFGHLSRGAIVSVLLVLATGLAPVNAQDSRRNMFEGLFGPPLRTPPSFSRPETTAPSRILLDSLPRPAEADNSAAENEAPSAPAEPSQAAATATTQTQERSTSGTPARPPRADAVKARADAVKESSIQRRQGTQPSQVRPNRRLSAKLIRERKGAKSRVQATGTWAKTHQPTRATRDARKIASARIGFAPRAAPPLPHGLMPQR